MLSSVIVALSRHIVFSILLILEDIWVLSLTRIK